MIDRDLYEFLEEHINEKIAVYAFPFPEINGIKLKLHVNAMVVSRLYTYDEIMSPTFRLKTILDEMYSKINVDMEEATW